MRRMRAMGVVLFLLPLTIHAETPARIDWMVKAYGDGQHNAFTDLIRWHDMYYLCFRHGAAHLSMDGEIRVMRSADLKEWEPCGALNTLGDDRDPHFAANDKRLYVFFGTWDLAHAPDHGLPGRGRIRSYMASTEDGTTWSKIQAVYDALWWLWRVHWQEDGFYSVAYSVEWPSRDKQEARLLRSTDCLNWETVSTVTKERKPDEADWLIREDKSMLCVMRTCDSQGDAMVLRSDPARKEWQKTDLGTLVHSPALLEWKGRIFVAGRGKHEVRADAAINTSVWELVGDKLQELITLPSSGDTGYPGLVLDPATIASPTPAFFVSWYSQHERDVSRKDEDSVYVARIVMEP